MKIGFFTDGYLPQTNGVTTSVYESAKELRRRGHEVFIIAPKYPGYVDSDKNVIRLTSVEVNKKPEIRLSLNLPDKSLRRVLSLDLDIIHGHSGGTITLLGWEAASLKSIPFIATYHTLWNRYTHYFMKGKVVKPKMMEQVTKIFGNRINALIAPTKRVEEELRRYGVKKPITVIPSGIDVGKFRSAEKGFLRKKTGIMDGPLVLFVGRLGKEKSVDFLIKSFAKVLKEVPSSHFLIVGDGVEKNRLKALSSRLKLGESVRFLGEFDQAEMHKVYKDSDVFVFASTTETQGLIVPEALASGVPVVVVKDPAYEAIENGKNGFMVEKNEKDFAEKITLLLKDHKKREQMSKNAAETAKSFDVSLMVDKMEEAYYKIIDQNNKLSITRIMDENKRSESVFVIGFSFWAALFLSKLYVFIFDKDYSYPVLNIAGSVFTFPSVGIFLCLIAIALVFINKKQIRLLPLLLAGTGAALFLGELASLFTTRASVYDYWNLFNFVPIFLLALISLYFLRTKQNGSPRFFINTRQSVHKNPEKPKITVVIPAYNEAGFIETNLKALLAQTYKNFELIVVDNNSSDNTGEIARKFGAKVILQKKKGVAWARQAGFFQAKGEIIACTDSDAVVPENWVEKIVDEFEKDRGMVAFGGLGYLYSGPIDARVAGRFLFPAFWIMDKYLSGGWNLNGFNLAVKKDAFVAIGGFRTDMTLGEDIDLSRRLREIGKIKIDTNFTVYVSGRRYKDGLISGVTTYVPSYIMRVLFKKDEFLTFNPVRSEVHSGTRLIFVPLALVILILSALFYLSNPR